MGYISDSKHLDIICIISYSKLSPFFLHYYQYNIYVNIYISLNHNNVRHIVGCLNIHDTLVSISTDPTQVYNVVVTYHHTIIYVTSKHCIVAINEYKGELHLIIYLKSRLCILCRVPLFPLAVYCCIFFIYIFPTTKSYTLSLFTHISFSR